MLIESHLTLETGQASTAGHKSQNEDCIGMCIPEQPTLTTKGIVSIIADGVSAAEAGKEASETCVRNFITDYYSTPDTWSVKKRGQKILVALNSWLVGQSQIKGHISTLSCLILKARSAYLFHIGDTRIYRLRDNTLECLTTDHCTQLNKHTTYLARAMGMDSHLDVDYQKLDTQENDLFFLSTDGIHDYIPERTLHAALCASHTPPLPVITHDKTAHYERVCQSLIQQALDAGSTDNLSCQILCINTLPSEQSQTRYQPLSTLTFPPILTANQIIDNFTIIKSLHSSKRSHVYLVKDSSTSKRFVIKAPSLHFQDDPAYIERFAQEQWIGKRIDSPYVVKITDHKKTRSTLYTVMEFIDGITLESWIRENPKPDIHEVVRIVEGISRGLRAFHRKDMIHQDIKPDNIIIDRQGIPKIIDFGSCYTAGIAEASPFSEHDTVLGTACYGAPETRFQQTHKTNKSDLFSLALVTYEMLTGAMPFGEQLEKLTDQRKLNTLTYQTSLHYNPMVPYWLDGALKKALSPSPSKRHEALSEFIYELKNPNAHYLHKSFTPLVEKNPLFLWQSLTAIEALLLLIILYHYYTA